MKKKEQKSQPHIVAGSGINFNSPKIKAAKTVDDLKKLEIYSHLTAKAQDTAYEELLAKIPVEEEV